MLQESGTQIEYVPNQGLFQEPRLHYQEATRRWEGENEQMVIWMTDETLCRYIQGYIDMFYGDKPTQNQRRAAAQHCLRLSYWSGCQRNGDTDLHVRLKTEVGSTYERLNVIDSSKEKGH